MRGRRRGGAVRLSTWTRGLVNLGGLGLWATGAAWLALHDFVVRQGEFGPQRSPLEPWMLKLHGAFAFLAIWTVGLLCGRHVVNGWRDGRRRWSGSVALAVLGVLTATGYLLYYVADDAPRATVSALHWIIGLAAPAAYLLHRLAGSRRRPPRTRCGPRRARGRGTAPAAARPG